MNLTNRLKEVVEILSKEKIQFALTGGLVSSLYRKEPRATADIDVIIMTNDEKKAQKIQKELNK